MPVAPPPHVPDGAGQRHGMHPPAFPVPSLSPQGAWAPGPSTPPAPFAAPPAPSSPPTMHAGVAMAPPSAFSPTPPSAAQPPGPLAAAAPAAAVGRPIPSPPSRGGVEVEEEDFGFGNVSRSQVGSTSPAQTAPTTDRGDKAGPGEAAASEAEKKGSNGVFGFITGLFGSKRAGSAEPTGPKQANLGEPSSFRYDETLKRWVDTKDPQSAQAAAAPPPPPMHGGPGSMAPAPGTSGMGTAADGAPASYRRGATRSARSRYVDPFNPGAGGAPAEDPTTGEAPMMMPPLIPTAPGAMGGPQGSQAPPPMAMMPQPEPTVYHPQMAPQFPPHHHPGGAVQPEGGPGHQQPVHSDHPAPGSNPPPPQQSFAAGPYQSPAPEYASYQQQQYASPSSTLHAWSTGQPAP